MGQILSFIQNIFSAIANALNGVLTIALKLFEFVFQAFQFLVTLIGFLKNSEFFKGNYRVI